MEECDNAGGDTGKEENKDKNGVDDEGQLSLGQEGEKRVQKKDAQQSDEEKPSDELETRPEPFGESFDPLTNLAVLSLVDIAPEIKRVRKIPRFYHIKWPETIIGTGRKAQVKADDFETVKEEHGVIVFQGGLFQVCPLEGEVYVDGQKIGAEGTTLKSGSHLRIGSAMFVFFSTNLGTK